MKRLVFLSVLMLMASTMIMAQGRQRGGEKNRDPKVRAERMTERMVKEYSLSDKQKQQLLELNTAMAAKMDKAPAARPSRQGKKGGKSECNCTCTQNKKMAQRHPGNKKGVTAVDKEAREAAVAKKRAEMKESREAYDTKLKSILTKDQYKAYSQKQEEKAQKMKERQEKMKERQEKKNS